MLNECLWKNILYHLQKNYLKQQVSIGDKLLFLTDMGLTEHGFTDFISSMWPALVTHNFMFHYCPNKSLWKSAQPDKLSVEASSILEKTTRPVHRLSSHMASSLEDQCRSGEITEETQRRCHILVYDGGAGESKNDRRRSGRRVSWDEESQAG